MPERAGGASPVRARSFEEERTMETRYTYRLETPADWAAAEALTREAFWNVYKPGCTTSSTSCAASPPWRRS